MNKEKSIEKNTLFYLVYTSLNVAFPFLTGIYVTRIFSPSSIGEVSYALNIFSYFVILAFLGIPTYGLREIAKNKKDKEALNKVFSELVIINSFSTTVCILVFIFLVLSVSKLRSNFVLYIIVGSLIFFNYLNISWLYEGLEEFKFISLRNIFFKCISFVLLILLVKKPDDLLWYAGVTVIGSAGNNIINVLYAKRFVKFTTRDLNFIRHLKPIFYLVFVNLAIELYSLVDVTMIGWLKDDASVAFYSYGNNINRILLQVINSFTIVVVPRLSAYYKDKKQNDFNELISKTFCLLMLFSLPMVAGIYFASQDIIVLLYGEKYIISSTILKVLSINLIISPIGYLLGSRVCLVVGKEKKMLFTVATGAVINVVGNFILINTLGCVGAAVASIISELIMMVMYIVQSRKYYKLIGIKTDIIKIIIAVIMMSIFLFMIGLFDIKIKLRVFIYLISAIICYFTVLAILKQSTAKAIMNKVISQV